MTLTVRLVLSVAVTALIVKAFQNAHWSVGLLLLLLVLAVEAQSFIGRSNAVKLEILKDQLVDLNKDLARAAREKEEERARERALSRAVSQITTRH